MSPWHGLRPAAAIIFGARLTSRTSAFHSHAVQTTCSRWVVREPPPSAPRESPTPLVLLRTPGLTFANPSSSASTSGETEDRWMVWADMFSMRGYTTVEVDVSVTTPSSQPLSTNDSPSSSEEGQGISGPVKLAASALNDQLRLLAIPFAPVIVASGPACLVAQAYVSDYPASGMVLIEPPPDDDPRGAGAGQGGGGGGVDVATGGAKAAGGEASRPFAWPRFSYEPRFPILLMPNPGDEARVRASRVGSAAHDRPGGRGVSIMTLKDGARGEGSRMEVERWLDMGGY